MVAAHCAKVIKLSIVLYQVMLRLRIVFLYTIYFYRSLLMTRMFLSIRPQLPTKVHISQVGRLLSKNYMFFTIIYIGHKQTDVNCASVTEILVINEKNKYNL